MAQGQYCIVDVTVDGSKPLDGLVGLTLEDAQSWIDANQVDLAEVTEEGHAVKYLIQPDNWVEVEE
jgi:hypothetical protein